MLLFFYLCTCRYIGSTQVVPCTHTYTHTHPHTPCSVDLPNSYWQCYTVHWDDKETDFLSPWDMHSVDSDLSAYIERVMTTPTTSLEQEWGGEREQERILNGLEIVHGFDEARLEEAHMFRKPVSLEEVPNYCAFVAFPTDLGTITEKLSHRLYRCVGGGKVSGCSAHQCTIDLIYKWFTTATTPNQAYYLLGFSILTLGPS